jgi:hypothetical protein
MGEALVEESFIFLAYYAKIHDYEVVAFWGIAIFYLN